MSLYSFQDFLQALQLLRDQQVFAGVVDEKSILDDRVKTVTAGEKQLADVAGDGNCMLHAFCRSAQIPDNSTLARQNAVERLRANPDAYIKGCDSTVNQVIVMGQHNSWDEYCDFLAQPAQGAGDVNHYGDIGLLIGLSGAYQLSINCVTSCPGESWLIIINATIHDYCETVTVAREGRLQEHYYATKDVNLSDLDVHLIHAARQAMPITLRLGSALRCRDKDMDAPTRILADLDDAETRLKRLRPAPAEADDNGDEIGGGQVAQTWLEAIPLCRRAIESLPKEKATLLAHSGAGKSFCMDALQYITAPTKEAYLKAGRKEEKEKVSDYLRLAVLAPLNEALKREDNSKRDEAARLLAKLSQTAKEYFEINANPALQEYIPGYLDQSVLDDIDDLEVPDEEASAAQRTKFWKNLRDVLDRLQKTIVEQPPEDTVIIPLQADKEKAKQSWARLQHKFRNVLWDGRPGNQETYLLHCSQTSQSTTRTTLSTEYSPTALMLVELIKARADVLMELMEVADNCHPQSPRYGTPEAREFRAADTTAVKKAMYEQLTQLRIPSEQELQALASSGDAGGPPAPSGGARARIRPQHRGFHSSLSRPFGDDRSVRMPVNANDIPLKEEADKILRGPRVIIHRGSNACLMIERLAVHDLLADRPDQIRRHLVEAHRLYSPSTINQHLTFLDSPGFGVRDPTERHETLKAMERATTLIFPSYKDLAHNEPAVEVLKQSRFVREGKAFIEERASNQSKQPDVTEAQHILILSYPEKDVLQKESVESLLDEGRAETFFDGLGYESFHEAYQRVMGSLLAPEGCAYESYGDTEKLRRLCANDSFSNRIDKLLHQTGLLSMLALPEYLQAKRLTPKIEALIDVIAGSQTEDMKPPVIHHRTNEVDKVLRNARELFNSLRLRKTDRKRRVFEQLESFFKEGGRGFQRTNEERAKIRKNIQGQRQTYRAKASAGTEDVVRELRGALASKRIPTGFFRFGPSRIGDIDVPAIIFSDLDILMYEGDLLQQFIREPLERLIDDLCNSYKDHIKYRLHGESLSHESCAKILQILNVACEAAKRDLRKWVLDKGTLKNILSRRIGKGDGITARNAREAKRQAFASYRARVRDLQLNRPHTQQAFLDTICDERALRECREEAVDLLFSLFLNKIGSGLRQGDLIHILITELEERALGSAVAKKNTQPSYRILFRRFRAAITDLCKANREVGDQQTDNVDERTRLMEVGARLQNRLEAVHADIQTLLTGSRTNPIPARAQHHLAAQVLDRKHQSMVAVYHAKYLDAARQLAYAPESLLYPKLRDVVSIHNTAGAINARDSPFDPATYRFLEPEEQAGDGGDVPPPAGKSSSRRRSKGSTKRKPQAQAGTLKGKDGNPLSSGNLEKLKQRLDKDGLELVLSSNLFEEHAATLVEEDGVTFSGGLMHAAAFVIHHSMKVLHEQLEDKAYKNRRKPVGKQDPRHEVRYRMIKDIVKHGGDLWAWGRQLINMVCATLVRDVIFANTAEAQDQRRALQDLFRIDLLVYIDVLTAEHVGADPALLYFVSGLYGVNIQIWNGSAPEEPPLLLGASHVPNNTFVLNLIFFPPTPRGDPSYDNRCRYGRWAAAVPKPPRPVDANKLRPKKRSSSGGGRDNASDNDSFMSGGGSGAESSDGGGGKRVRWGDDAEGGAAN